MKTLKKVPIELVGCEFIPETLEFGKIYYSREYKISNHLCPCGCETQVPLPIKDGEWSLTLSDGKVTITPSIQQRFYCLSHYVITNGVANMLNEPTPKESWYRRSNFDDSQPGE